MPKYDVLLPKIEFLKKDFLTLSDKLVEEYHPGNITALANVGTVLMTMMLLEQEHKIDEITRDVIQDKTDEVVHDDIHGELMEAEKYYEKWAETKDPSYKQMAKDELRHADFLIKHGRMHAKGPEQEKIQSYTDWYNQLLARVG